MRFFRRRHSAIPSILTSSRAPLNATLPASRRISSRKKTLSLDFPSGWGVGELSDWYHRPTIKTLQLRKEHDPFQHEYLLAVLTNRSMFRMDCRPDPKLPVNTLMRYGCTAIDTLEEVSSIEEMNPSHCVIDVQCDNDYPDVVLLLRTCFAISSDETAKNYTIQKFNCYFYAWTNLLVLLRHLGDGRWQDLLEESAKRRVKGDMLNRQISRWASGWISSREGTSRYRRDPFEDLHQRPFDEAIMLEMQHPDLQQEVANTVTSMVQYAVDHSRWTGLWQCELWGKENRDRIKNEWIYQSAIQLPVKLAELLKERLTQGDWEIMVRDDLPGYLKEQLGCWRAKLHETLTSDFHLSSTTTLVYTGWPVRFIYLLQFCTPTS
jgi:hypothetical protein